MATGGFGTLSRLSNPIDMEEFDGENWVPRGTVQQFKKRYPAINQLSSFPLSRQEVWTSACYKLRWKFRSVAKPASDSSESDEGKKDWAVFLRQKFLWRIPWRLRRAKIDEADEVYTRKLAELKIWLIEHYPHMEIQLDKLSATRLGSSVLVSNAFLQVLVTAILAGLTHGFKYKPENSDRAAWLLVFMYGGSILRWLWFVNDHMDKHPCTSPVVWFLYGIGRLLQIPLAVGVFGGISVMAVELLEIICFTTYSLSPAVWTLTGVCIGLGFGLVSAIVIWTNVAVGITPPPACH